MQIERRTPEMQKNPTSKAAGTAKTSQPPAKSVSSGEERPRRAQPN